MACDAVGAEEEGRPVLYLYHLHVDFDALFGAESAADDVAARMGRCLLRRHAPGAHLLFDDRVVRSLAMKLSVRAQAVEARVADVAEGRNVAVQVKGYDGRRHSGELRAVLRHLVDGFVGALDGYLHQVFYVRALYLMTKGFVQDFNRRLRSDFAGLRAAHAVRYSEDAPLSVRKVGVFIERTLLAQAAVRDGRGFYGHARSLLCH